MSDFNNDGFDDLVVGAPGESPGSDPQSGFAFVFNGSSDGLVASQGLDQEGLGNNEAGDLFGAGNQGFLGQQSEDDEQTGDTVYRFFNNDLKVRFYRSSAAEKDNVESTLPGFQFEEVAYYTFSLLEQYQVNRLEYRLLFPTDTLNGVSKIDQ